MEKLTGFTYYECPTCQYDTILQTDGEHKNVYCPLCADDNGKDVIMRGSVATVADRPEGRDDRMHDEDAQKKVIEYKQVVDAHGSKIRFIEKLPGDQSFQKEVFSWTVDCFGYEVSFNKAERLHRFIEEALELVQSLGMDRMDAHLLVDYVYGRPKGEPLQEMGGTMTTLAALGNAHGMSMVEAGDKELGRCWGKIEVIREKQRNKPKGALPEGLAAPDNAPTSLREAFKAGWYVNACLPADYGPEMTEQQGKDYLEGCEQADWLEYWSTVKDQ